jgi:hypothetical protein
MTLPNYDFVFFHWKTTENVYKEDLSYGLQYIENTITAYATTITEKDCYKLRDNLNNRYTYYFPHIPSKEEYEKCLKDFLLQIKLRNIQNDFK